ncbi:MAG: hypothetical protein KUF74_13750 [Candidatus Thiodiazotropha sp. (ex Ctena orbiculata)]|nr:hypothetical protein [Candidatus Thiodiazotropha taylori]
MNFTANRWIPLFVLTFTLLACGGDEGSADTDSSSSSLNYSGETKQASMTSENVNQLASAATSGSKQAVSSDSVPVVSQRPDSPVDQDQINQDLARLVGDILNRGPQLAGRGEAAARTEDLSSSYCNSGSVEVDFPDFSLEGEWRIVFTQCSRDTSYENGNYSTVFHGTVEGTYRKVRIGYQLTLNYINFNVSISNPGGSYSDTFNMQMTCIAANSDGSDVSCEYYSDYQGYDNRTYRVTEVSVSGNEASGYLVSVRVYDPEHGYFHVTTEVPLTFDCATGRPSAGRIQIEAANGVTAVVEFISCTQYVVTFLGVAETYDWP